MFFVSLGIATGAPVTLASFLVNNLVPVTLGNMVAGALGMAASYALLFGSLGNRPKAVVAV